MPLVKKENSADEKLKKEETSFSISKPKYSIDEMILEDSLKEKIEIIISAEKNYHQVFEVWNLQSVIKNRKNILVNFWGTSGTGKTMAGNAVANALGKEILIVNYAEIESKYVGETSKNLEALFKFAEEQDVVIFFDEADALLSKRVTDMTHSTDVSVNQTRSVLLNILNSYTGMVIFATNFISNYDSAFLRRIQYHIEFTLPSKDLRKKLWQRYIPQEMPNDLDIESISEKYDNLSGNDISTAVLQASLKAAKKNESIVSEKYFEEACESILKTKEMNSSNGKTTETSKVVSREYVAEKIGEEEVNKIEAQNK